MNEKRVMVMRNDPRKKYFLISAKLKEQVGALADMTKILAIRGVDILEGYIHVTEEPMGYVTLFAEATDKKADANFLRQMLEGSTFIESVTVLESRKGMIIDTLNFPLMTDFGERSVLLSVDAMREAFQQAKEGYGRIGSELIYALGYCQRSGAWPRLLVGRPMDKESLQEFLELYSAVGMGKATIEKFNADAKTLSIAVDRSFECEGLRSDSPTSLFLLGVLAGGFTSLFGRDMVAKETRCVAMGAKRCEFEIGPKPPQASTVDQANNTD